MRDINEPPDYWHWVAKLSWCILQKCKHPDDIYLFIRFNRFIVTTINVTRNSSNLGLKKQKNPFLQCVNFNKREDKKACV